MLEEWQSGIMHSSVTETGMPQRDTTQKTIVMFRSRLERNQAILDAYEMDRSSERGA